MPVEAAPSKWVFLFRPRQIGLGTPQNGSFEGNLKENPLFYQCATKHDTLPDMTGLGRSQKQPVLFNSLAQHRPFSLMVSLIWYVLSKRYNRVTFYFCILTLSQDFRKPSRPHSDGFGTPDSSMSCP